MCGPEHDLRPIPEWAWAEMDRRFEEKRAEQAQFLSLFGIPVVVVPGLPSDAWAVLKVV